MCRTNTASGRTRQKDNMGLFQKRPPTTNSQPYYTLGQQKTVAIVGLGNPGSRYDDTRHNIGFKVVDYAAQKLDFPGWQEKKDLKARIALHTIGANRVILVKPLTFMNNSGDAVQAVLNYYKIPPVNCVVVHDELAIPYGQIRTRVGGSAAGHNGVESIIQKIGDNFGRVRIGIGSKDRQQADSRDFVLSPFSQEEQDYLPALLKEAHSMLTEYMFGGQLNHDTRNFIV